MTRYRVAGVLGGVLLAGALLTAPVGGPVAAADPCPDAQVVFGRGSGEPVGLGGVGQAFVAALRGQAQDKSIADYPVNYPATHDYHSSSEAGVADTVAQVRSVIDSCPDTKIVLGGYSQGALVMELASERLPAEAAEHVAAVTLFGPPTTASGYATSVWGGPLPELAPAYQPKSIDFCVPDDIVCAPAGNMVAHALGYAGSPMPQQAAEFVAGKL